MNKRIVNKDISFKFFVNILLVFILFLLISYFIPLTGDDWTNACFKTNNIFKILEIAYSKYFLHEGRFVSRIFVVFFTNSKWLWNIVNSLMIATVCFVATKLINPKRYTFTSLVFILSMLFVENTMFTQSYLWVTGNTTYYLPMFLVFVYLFFIDGIWQNNFNFSKLQIIAIIIINILVPTMVEHVSVALVVANIFLLIYSLLKRNTRKFSYLFLIVTIISFVGFLFIYLSPGAAIRASGLEFTSYSLIKKLSINIPNFVNYTYIQNPMLILLIMVMLSTWTYRKNIKKIYKVPLIFLSSIIPFLTFLCKCLGLIASKSSKITYILDKISFVMDSNNIFIILFWIMITIILGIINVVYLKKTNNYKALFVFVVGIIANISMLLSPIWGGRTALFTLTFLYIDILIILEFLELNINYKIITKILYIVFLTYIVVLLILYYSVYIQRLERENSIKRQLAENVKVINIERFPDDVLWNSNAYNEFHENVFKQYYSIPDELEIVRDKVYYKYRLIYRR